MTHAGKPKSLSEFCKLAVKWGARAAKVIPARNVFPAAWVRMKCQFGCDGYGSCLTCPPHAPTPAQTKEVLRCYRKAILIRCEEQSRGVKKLVVKLEREMFLGGYYKALAYGAGPCRLCKSCNLRHCRHPEQARVSMEGAGIDVFRTARANGFRIDVVKTYDSPQNYFGLVLGE